MKQKYEISYESLKKEKETQHEINECILKGKSFIFRAGAGVGKTYALVESIKFIIDNFSDKLKRKNQFISAITYTNAAANEIKERIGNSSFVRPSTIHDFIWELISPYKYELLEFHIEEIDKELIELENKKSDNFTNYISKPNKFEELKDNPEFYRITKSNDIKEFYGFNIAGNVRNFHKAAKAYVETNKLIKTKNQIINLLNNSLHTLPTTMFIKYNEKSNIKNLAAMRIDHDILITYFVKMVNKYPNFRKIIIDKYPVILIDEFQDTNNDVISAMLEIHNYSKEKHNFILGFFGDLYQNIYNTNNDSIKLEIKKAEAADGNDFQIINKVENRRCPTQVIELANKFNTSIKQESIYSNHNDGMIKILSKDEDLEILKDYSKQYESIDCLVLKNRTICEKLGFINIFNVSSKLYAKKYAMLNDELLSHEETKLGVAQLLFLRILKYYNVITSPKLNLNEAACGSKSICIDDINYLIHYFEKFKDSINENTTLNDYINYLFSIEISNKNLRKSFTNEVFSKSYSINEFIEKINKAFDFDDEEEGESPYNKLTAISFQEWLKWYSYISETNYYSDMSNVRLHTYHSTKGLEFETVVIVLEDETSSFDKGNIKNYLSNINENSNIDCDENMRNLLYVAITRSYKNLIIINNTSLSDDIINNIFKS